MRELLGITAEEFQANPELYSVIATMNQDNPIDDTSAMGNPLAESVGRSTTLMRMKRHRLMNYDVLGLDEEDLG